MSHDHSNGHSHTPASFDRAFAIGIALNLGFVAIEAGYGFVADSVALLADAGHNLSDVLGLALAWGGATLAKRSEEHTSELQSLMRISYAVFCLKKKNQQKHNITRSVPRNH